MTYVNPARAREARADIAHLQPVAIRNGYVLEYHPTTRVRGWPRPSARPFQLRRHIDGAYLASFETFAALERGFRARAGL